MLKSIDAPATFWLDGHYSSGNTSRGKTNTPILNELELIRQHPIKTHTILIDDVRQFGCAEFDFIELNEVVDVIKSINPNYSIMFEDGFVQNDILVAVVNDSSFEPPRLIPENLYDQFTFESKIPVIYEYKNGSYSGDTPIIYTQEMISKFIYSAKNRQTMYYGETDLFLYDAIEKYLSFIQGKSVAVMGSVIPWYESILLSYGAMPTTIEYNKIISEDPRLKVYTVHEFNAEPFLFDAILSISSFEHDGLGRYGDPIDPNGDFSAMDKAKSMLKRDGLLFLSVPVGKDCLVWNLHRIYGRLRLKALLKGWQIVEYFGFSYEHLDRDAPFDVHQPIFVLKQI